MPQQVTITTGARLHFGILSYHPETGRHFGGAGLMIDSPGFQLTTQTAQTDEVLGPDEYATRCREFLTQYRSNCSVETQPPSCRIEIGQTIPAHIGLGSGTQLGLAVAKSLSLLAGEEETDSATLAIRTGRGLRSALGIHGFAQGGFLLDGGKARDNSIGCLNAREEFPADWRILLVTPGDSSAGLSGQLEREAFSQLPSMPEAITERLRQIAHAEMLPAVQEIQFERFSQAVYEFGTTVGAFFAPVQGGIYADAQMTELVEFLRSEGISGVGQTSWGPTLFVVLPDQATAERMQNQISGDDRWKNCHIQLARPLNNPAAVEIQD